MIKVIALLALTLLASCTSTTQPSPTPQPIVNAGCAVETAITTALSTSLSSILTCTNNMQIQSDIQGALGRANLCQQAVTLPKNKLKGAVGNLLCPLAVTSVVSYLGTQIPAAWSCSPSADTTDIAAALTTACSKNVPF